MSRQRAIAAEPRNLRKSVLSGAMLVVTLVWLSPMAFLLMNTLKTATDYTRGPLKLPTSFNLFHNIANAWAQGIQSGFINSLLYGAADTPQKRGATAALPSYQWHRDGLPIAGATDASLTLNAVTSASAGRFTVTISGASGSVSSLPATLSVRALTPSLTAGMTVAPKTADRSPHVFFAVESAQPKRVLVRVAGPALTGLGGDRAVADPSLEIVDVLSGAVVAANDDWSQNANMAELTAAVAQTGAFPFPAGSKDAAVVLTLPGSRRTWLPSPPPRCVTKLKTPTTAAATAASTMPRRHDGPGRSARRVTSA